MRVCVSFTRPHEFLPTPPLPVPADVSRVSARLVEDSKMFKSGAKRLNTADRWRQALPYIAVALFVLFLLWWRLW